MPEYLAPGVYVEERDSGAKAIEGVSTTTTGMVGVTERGPEKVPTLVIGFADFRRQFGGLLDRAVYTNANWYLPYAVDGFFTNGGKRCYVVRVLPDSASAASAALFGRETAGGVSATLAAATRIHDGALLVADGGGIAAGGWLKIDDGASTEYVQVLDATNATPLSRRHGAAFAHAAGQTVTGISTALTALGTIAAVNAGVSTITISGSAATLNDGDVLQIGSAAGELVIVKGTFNIGTTGTAVGLKYPLASSHGNVSVAVVGVTPATGAAPTLLTPIAAGERTFVTTGFGTVPTIVRFDGPTSSDPVEYDFVDTIAGTRLTLPLQDSHDIGTVIEGGTLGAGTAVALAADAAAGATKLTFSGSVTGSVLEIGGGTTAEIVGVASFDTTTHTATLQQPLLFAHPHTDPVKDTAFTVNDSMTLATPAHPSESLLLTPGTFAAADTVIHIQDGAKSEFRMRRAQATISAATTGKPAAGTDPANPVPVEFEHSAGRPLLGRSIEASVNAIDRGQWGNDLFVIVEDEIDQPLLDTTVMTSAPSTATEIELRTVVGIEAGTVLEVGYTSTQPGRLMKVTSVSATGKKAAFATPIWGAGVAPGDKVRTREFRLSVQLRQINPATNKPRVIESEGHRHLSMDSKHSRYFVNVIGPIFQNDAKTPRGADGRTHGESNLIRVSDSVAPPDIRLGPDINTDTLPDGRVVPVATRLGGGDDRIGDITEDTYIGVDDLNPADRTGLCALKNVDEISIVAIPGHTEQKVQQALIDHCELLRYRFAILDAGAGENMAAVQEHRSLYDSSYAAIYHPWLFIDDPFPENPRVGGEIAIPPSGHMAGIYARSDIERGVHKAPANEVVRGIVDLVSKLAKEHQDILNPRNVNVIRNFRDANRALRVWGARTLSSDPDWKYINVRRLFIFLEHSIDRGTQWVVFEPNSELLWQRVRRVISEFLKAVWRDGALMGLKPEEAYYVKCDRTTMSQNDIDNGRLIVEIGVAPVKPAEFVIFRIGQWAGGSSVDEG